MTGIGVGAVIAGVWTFARPDGNDAVVRATPRPTAPAATVPAASKGEIDAVVEELLTFIEDVRGLPATSVVNVELQDDETFLAGVLEDLDPDDELPGVGLTLQALKLVEPGTDLLAELKTALGDGVLGYYDPEEDALFVRGTALTPFLRVTLVHELTHAVQDQHFGLEGFEDLEDEAAVGFQGLVEGDAVSVQVAYLKSLPPSDQIKVAQEASGFLAGGSEESLAVLEEVIGFPYSAGPPFVEALLEESTDGDYAEVDAAYERPPASSEQVLHPEAYLDNDTPLDITRPEPAGELVDDGEFGEFLLGVLLRQVVPKDEALLAAEGWGGDAYATWRAGDAVVFSALFRMDSSKDRDELVAALEAWTAEHGSAAVTQEGRTVALEARVDVPAGGATNSTAASRGR